MSEDLAGATEEKGPPTAGALLACWADAGDATKAKAAKAINKLMPRAPIWLAMRDDARINPPSRSSLLGIVETDKSAMKKPPN